jgi:hypothetical protein
MGTREAAKTNQVNVFLNCGSRYLLGCLVQSKIDYFKTGIPVGAGNNLSTAVVTIQPRFSH